MKAPSRVLALFMSVVLAAGLCPGFAYAGDLVGNPTMVTETLDLSDGILQEGGLNQPAAPSSSRLTVMSAADEEGFMAALKSAAESWNGVDPEISVNVSAYGVSRGQVGPLFKRFINDNGQFFYLSGSYSYSMMSDSASTVAEVTLSANTDYSASDLSNFAAAVDDALAGIESGWTDEQKALYLHDWVVTHCEYEKKESEDDDYKRYSAYDALVVGSAVCQGYALAYDYLLERAGIESGVITSEAINHAWNLVTIGGQTYYADCTWDDPSNINFTAYCKHENFLRSKSAFGHVGDNSDEPAHDWLDSTGVNVYESETVAVSDAYDAAYWSDVTTAIPHVDSLWGYVSTAWRESEASVSVHDYSTGEDRELASGIPGMWNVWGNSSSYYPTHYTSLVSDGDAFYASAPAEIYKVDASGVKAQVHELSATESARGYVYGLTFDVARGECVYELGESLLGAVTGSGAYTIPDYVPPVTAVAGVSLSQASLSLDRGQTATLTASVTPATARNKAVSWSVANPKIATVSSGTVTGVSAGTTTVTAKTADGGFTATCTVTVKQTALTQFNTSFGAIAKQTYTGSAITPAPTVKFGSTALVKGVDYTLSYKNNVGVGTATVTASGIGNYSGQASATFTIGAASLSKASVTLAKTSMAYTGSALKPAVTSVKLGSVALKAGSDYTVAYSANTNAGTAVVTVSGKGNYAGSAFQTFSIAKAANTLKVSGKTAGAKYSKAKASTVKAAKAYSFKNRGKGTLSYLRVSKGSSKWLPKVNSKTGAITVKKGTPKGETQTVKVKVTAKGDANHKAGSKTVTVKVKVK